MSTTQTQEGFDALNLSASALKLVKKLGIEVPTPIQAAAIPAALTGKDIFGIAQTGTGKTLAFALPIIERLMPGEQAVVLAPTRELADQIEMTFRKLDVRTALLIGGANMYRQITDLKRRPSVIIATPGRMMDHIEQRTLRLNSVTTVVLDEADRMLDIGFAPIIKKILGHVPKERQTMLFSATMSREIEDLAVNYMVDPTRIEMAPQGTTAERVKQELVCARHEDKHSILKEIMYQNEGTILVFSRTRHGARKIAQFARDHGHSAAEIHSDRTLVQRRDALAGFKNGRFRVLVATDIAARGIDVKEISLVVNFDIPEHAEDYVHRIGRTGRAGAEGHAITFTMPAQWREVRDIEKLIGMEIPTSELSVEQVKRPEFDTPKPARNRNRGGQSGNQDRGPRNGSGGGPGMNRERSTREGQGTPRQDGDRPQRRNDSRSNDSRQGYQGNDNRPAPQQEHKSPFHQRTSYGDRPRQDVNRAQDNRYQGDSRSQQNVRPEYNRQDSYRQNDRPQSERPREEYRGNNDRPAPSRDSRPHQSGYSRPPHREQGQQRSFNGDRSSYQQNDRVQPERESRGNDGVAPRSDTPISAPRFDKQAFRQSQPKPYVAKPQKKGGAKRFGNHAGGTKPAPIDGGSGVPKKKFSEQFGPVPRHDDEPRSPRKRSY